MTEGKQIGIEHLYKILTHDAQSAYGGVFDWTPYLPKWKWTDFDNCQGKWTPGEWVNHPGKLIWCQSGFHLTCDPLRWMVKMGRVFLAEYRGEWIQDNTGDKTCFAEVRLIAELGIDSLNLGVKLFKLINSGTNLSSANLSYANLRSANLRSANLRSANLRSADLSSADLSSADLRSADLSYANLSYANLRSAYLRLADLSSADLRYANLSSANLSLANLSSANLSSANLLLADLSSADLSSANLLEGVYIDKDPKIKGYRFENGRLWK